MIRCKPAALAAAACCILLAPMNGRAADTLPPLDPISVWTLAGENSTITTSAVSDRYYTNGLKLGFVSGTESVPDPLRWLGTTVFGDTQMRVSANITQQIFTPKDTKVADPAPGDRPYAGLLLADLGLVADTAGSRGMLDFSIGMLGPSALAENTQNGFHDLIGQEGNKGWHTQLHDEAVFELRGAKTWRVETGGLGGLETDVLPEASVGVGTIRVYGEAGAQFRLGSGLQSDFGTARLPPGPSGGDVFRPVQPLDWYVFVGASGQAVAHDITLDGNTWHDSRSVTVQPLIGELQGGLAVIYRGMRLSYTQVFQTAEFKHQKGGLHQFGSLALSVRF